jgi:hypothetical protein
LTRATSTRGRTAAGSKQAFGDRRTPASHLKTTAIGEMAFSRSAGSDRSQSLRRCNLEHFAERVMTEELMVAKDLLGVALSILDAHGETEVACSVCAAIEQLIGAPRPLEQWYELTGRNRDGSALCVDPSGVTLRCSDQDRRQ